MKNKFILGADPELFMVDKRQVGKSVIGIMPGTKQDPHIISDKGHSVQVDNVALEFNVPPSSSANEMYSDIQFVLSWFKNNIPKGHDLSIIPSLTFPEKELRTKEAKMFGCDPDLNAWTEKTNNPPDITGNLRSCGGHIHISYPGATMDKSFALIKACDLFLGVPSLLFDNDSMRRNLYGKAGAFRFKRYPDDSAGAEYRTLSNYWIKDEKYVKFVFEQIDKAFDFINTNPEIESSSELGKQINECINTNNIVIAKSLIAKYAIVDLTKFK